MPVIAEKVLKDALGLPPIERAELIHQLFQSFDISENNCIEAAWAEEIESRIEAYEKGLLAASPAEDVLARINKQ